MSNLQKVCRWVHLTITIGDMINIRINDEYIINTNHHLPNQQIIQKNRQARQTTDFRRSGRRMARQQSWLQKLKLALDKGSLLRWHLTTNHFRRKTGTQGSCETMLTKYKTPYSYLYYYNEKLLIYFMI